MGFNYNTTPATLTDNQTSGNPVSATTVAILGGIFFLIGFTGNVLVVIIYSISPLLRKPHNIFIANLAVIDLVILCFASPVALTIQFGDEGHLLRTNHTACTSLGVASSIVFCVNACAMATIAVNRYVSIYYPMKSKRYFSTKRCVFYVSCIWTFEMVIYLPLFGGWGHIVYDADITFCVLDIKRSSSFNIFSLILSIVLPTLVTLVCYVAIFIKVRQSKRKLQFHQTKNEATFKKGDVRLAVQMLIIMAICYISWAPYIAVMRLYTGVATWYMKLIISSALVFNSIVNPFVYFYYNGLFRRECLRIIRCQKVGTGSEPEGTTG